MKNELPELMTITKVAEYFQCHPNTVRRMITDGRLKAIRTYPRGKYALTRISVNDVHEFIDAQNQSK